MSDACFFDNSEGRRVLLGKDLDIDPEQGQERGVPRAGDEQTLRQRLPAHELFPYQVQDLRYIKEAEPVAWPG